METVKCNSQAEANITTAWLGAIHTSQMNATDALQSQRHAPGCAIAWSSISTPTQQPLLEGILLLHLGCSITWTWSDSCTDFNNVFNSQHMLAHKTVRFEQDGKYIAMLTAYPSSDTFSSCMLRKPERVTQQQ